jgi:predicted SnoaL-like aldol condensation-catalyzing enzyme
MKTAHTTAAKPSEGLEVLVRQYFQRLLNEKDLTVCDVMLSNQYIDHDAPPDPVPGPQGAKEFVARFLDAYPDMHVEIVDLLVDGNKVAARLVWKGHHRESRETYHQAGIIILHFNEQGQIVERWSAYQAL